MIRSLQAILNADLQATDGPIGRCSDFLFDDKHWTVRYMVADTGKWLPGLRVLISPSAIFDWDWKTDQIPVRLTREDIQNSPSLASDMPVSRQYEQQLVDQYGWIPYWHGPHVWGPVTTPFSKADIQVKPIESIESAGKSHLRSVKEVAGYHVEATDGSAGRVDDFLLDHDVWAIRYLVVDTRKWLSGRKVLISPTWARRIDWKRSQLHVRMNRGAIENSPVFDREHGPTRDDELALFKHYDMQPYWLNVE
ncbi:MAG: hypothetical protein PVJ53_06050 [Desulfobacterales bacterium]|jgi:hypothetical protein